MGNGSFISAEELISSGITKILQNVSLGRETSRSAGIPEKESAMRTGTKTTITGTYEITGISLIVAGLITLVGLLFNPLTTQSLLFLTFGYLMYALPLYLLWLGYTFFSARYTGKGIIELLRAILIFPSICWIAGSIELLVRYGSSREEIVLAAGKFGLFPLSFFSSFTNGYWTVFSALAAALCAAVFVLLHPLQQVLRWVFFRQGRAHFRKQGRKRTVISKSIPAPVLVHGKKISTSASGSCAQGSDSTDNQKPVPAEKNAPIAEQPQQETSTALNVLPSHLDRPLPVSILPEHPLMRKLADNEAQRELLDIEKRLIDVIYQLTSISIVRAQGREPLMGISTMQFAFRPHESNRKAVRKLINLNYDLALELKRSPVQITIKDVIIVEVPLTNQERTFVYIKELLTREEIISEPTYLIGKTAEGRPFELPVKKSLNILIGGQVGTGKSVLLHSIIFGLVFRWKPSEVQLALYDHKVEEFKRYSRLPHLWCPVADNMKKFETMLEKLEQELERRKRIREKDEHAGFPLLVVVMDEFRGLSSERLMTLISECRSLNMTFVLATQYPRSDVISTPIKANLTTGISFRMRDSTGSRLIIGESGGEMLMDNGDCLVSTSFCFEHAQSSFCRREDLQAVGDYLQSL